MPMAYPNDVENETETAQNGTDNQQAIFLDTKLQQRANIKTSPITIVQRQMELLTYGEAINTQPLYELRSRYLNAISEQSHASVTFNQSQKNKNRQQNLYQFGATSKYKYLEQQSQTLIDKTQLEISSNNIRSLTQQAKLKWGDKISTGILSDNGNGLTSILNGQETLIRVTLPNNLQSVAMPQTIYVGANSNRELADDAELISIAPSNDNPSAGLAYFFKTRSNKIKPGMNIIAWIPQSEMETGAIIPKSALLWILEQSFVYLKVDNNRFARKAILKYSQYKDGYFTTDKFEPKHEIVVTGTGTILSEELRNHTSESD